ncbi:hypothetical protein EJ02DRAFT_173314 [Clathrospora elynae]|uniref:Uncharacterized protein n=1 Tax=Clathrospora elynae TaxID=706981 RepID=A0A6A5T2A0_9PLEO|nr:hypothetical protein EJ02DRAFT_173314 [Clathrospora elynae]
MGAKGDLGSACWVINRSARRSNAHNPRATPPEHLIKNACNTLLTRFVNGPCPTRLQRSTSHIPSPPRRINCVDVIDEPLVNCLFTYSPRPYSRCPTDIRPYLPRSPSTIFAIITVHQPDATQANPGTLFSKGPSRTRQAGGQWSHDGFHIFLYVVDGEPCYTMRRSGSKGLLPSTRNVYLTAATVGVNQSTLLLIGDIDC